MKNVCILDLDGTLVDTIDSLLYCVNKTLEPMHLPKITWHQCRDFVGNGARSLLEQSILSSQDVCEEAVLDKASEIFAPIFADNCMYKVAPYGGVQEMLDGLKSKDVKLAVLSNKPHARTVEIVEHYFGKGYFDYIQGQREDVPRKPDPESIYYTMKQMGVEKENCIYVGDSEVDMETGARSNVTTVGVSWGFRDRIILENMNPEVIIDHPEQLILCIKQMNEE